MIIQKDEYNKNGIYGISTTLTFHVRVLIHRNKNFTRFFKEKEKDYLMIFADYVK